MHQTVENETAAEIAQKKKRDAKGDLERTVLAARRAVGTEARSAAAYAFARALNLASHAGMESSEIYDVIGDWCFDDFVFRYTHFDNLSNWYFFRRS